MTGPIELDPAAVVQAAPARIEELPDDVRQPPPTLDDPTPDPIPLAGDVRMTLDLDALPAILKSADGQSLRLASAVAVLWQLLHALEIRAITGNVVLTSAPGGIGGQIWQAGQSTELAMTWDEPAPVVPTGVPVTVEGGILNAGKLVGTVKPGTLTTTGCTVVARNVSAGNVIINQANPVLFRGTALYLFTPPLTTT